jgi:hypothetical protein
LNQPQGSAPLARPWQATIQAKLTRLTGIDEIEEIDYENGGHFSRRVSVVGGPSPGVIEVLDNKALTRLLADLRVELKSLPPGADRVGLEVFTDLIEAALATEPASTRFDTARFGEIRKDETRHILYGHLVLGVDVMGTVRDMDYELSFEQHAVVLPPGAYRPLSPADRASLARALEAHPPPNPLWQEILKDASAKVF